MHRGAALQFVRNVTDRRDEGGLKFKNHIYMQVLPFCATLYFYFEMSGNSFYFNALVTLYFFI